MKLRHVGSQKIKLELGNDPAAFYTDLSAMLYLYQGRLKWKLLKPEASIYFIC